MGKKRYSAEFKELIEEKLRAGVLVSQLAREYELIGSNFVQVEARHG